MNDETASAGLTGEATELFLRLPEADQEVILTALRSLLSEQPPAPAAPA